MDAIRSLFTLSYLPKPYVAPLPPHISRTFIPSQSSPAIKLELLSNTSSSTTSTESRNAPLLFLHGGLGHAAIYLPFQTYMHNHAPDRKTYSLSLRNHGASSPLCYLSMVWGSSGSLTSLASDLSSAVDHIHTIHGQYPIIVAHSSGAGITQYALAHNLIKASGLVLLDAVPHFGNLGAYANWARLDPLFGLRIWFHLLHPASPLSSRRLVRGAFFGDSFPNSDGQDKEIGEFMQGMPHYESLTWPLAMMGSLWGWITGRDKWLDAKHILTNIITTNSSTTNNHSDKICVLVGSQDKIIDVSLAKKTARRYRAAVREVNQTKNLDDYDDSDYNDDYDDDDDEKDGKNVKVDEVSIPGVHIETDTSVQFVIVDGAGHHVQNDVQRDLAAEAILRFVRQVT